MVLLKCSRKAHVIANPATRNHSRRSYWITNRPEANWWVKMITAGTMSRDSSVLPTDKEKRCRKRALKSKARSTPASDIRITRPDEHDLPTARARFVVGEMELDTVGARLTTVWAI